MSRDEFIGKLQKVYVGNRNAFNEIVGVYDNLKEENQRLNNIIKFLKKYFKEHEYYEEKSLLEQLESKSCDENWNGWKEL